MLEYYDGIAPSPYGIRAWNKPGVLCIKMRDYKLAKDFLGEKYGFENGPIRILWIGEMFYKGLGTERNYLKAYQYFNHIFLGEGPWGSDVEQYYPDVYADACYRLYECFAYGRGVDKDTSKAENFFKLALKYGSSSAIYDDQRRYEITER